MSASAYAGHVFDRRGRRVAPADEPDARVVRRCANEARAVAPVIDKAFRGLWEAGAVVEVIGPESGSTERSRAIADGHEARALARPLQATPPMKGAET